MNTTRTSAPVSAESASTATAHHVGVLVANLDSGQWAAEFGMSFAAMCIYDVLHGRQLVDHNRNPAPGGDLAGARNRVAWDFLQSSAEWLLWLDSDMSFEPDTLERLLASADPTSRPVMAALCFAWCRAGYEPDSDVLIGMWVPTLFDFVDDQLQPTVTNIYAWEARESYPPDQLVRVDATGSACVLIHRTVFEAVYAADGPRWYRPIEAPRAHDPVVAFSEDISFCVRLASLGIPVHVHTGIKTGHHKGVAVGTERAWLEQESSAKRPTRRSPRHRPALGGDQ